MNNNTELATEILTDITDKHGYALGEARLYGVTVSGEKVSLGSAPDVYLLLDTDYNDDLRNARGISKFAVVTTGWAAPLNEDGTVEGAPSEHPKRRRVCLVAVVGLEGVVSALRFEDEPDDIVTDEGGAHGSLNDALLDLRRLVA